MGRDQRGIDGGNYDYVVADLLRVAAAASNDAEDFQAATPALVEPMDEVGADLALGIATADREDKNRVHVVGLAGAQPGSEDGLPSLVVGPCGQFGDVVGRCIGFDPAQLTEVIHGMAAMSGAPADAEQEQAPAALPQFNESERQILDALVIDGARDLARLSEKRLNVTHARPCHVTPVAALLISLPRDVKLNGAPSCQLLRALMLAKTSRFRHSFRLSGRRARVGAGFQGNSMGTGFFDPYDRFYITSQTGPSARRLNARYEAIIGQNIDLLRHKRVLDVASHDGSGVSPPLPAVAPM
jgi:hypothetical protein